MAEQGIAPGLSVVGHGIWSALGPDGPSTIAGIRGQIIGSVRNKDGTWNVSDGETRLYFQPNAPGEMPKIIEQKKK